MEGVQVIKRPPEIAGDKAPTIDAILHALNHYNGPDIESKLVVLLQPTSPFRTSSDINAALDIFFQNDCDSVISVVETTHPPYWNMVVNKSYLQPLFDQASLRKRRQDLPKTYLPNGAIYIANAETLQQTHSFFTPKIKPYIMPAERSIDIDSEFDLLFAEALMKHGEDDD
jgi:N-acylneuraminate cytidylyltransferase